LEIVEKTNASRTEGNFVVVVVAAAADDDDDDDDDDADDDVRSERSSTGKIYRE